MKNKINEQKIKEVKKVFDYLRQQIFFSNHINTQKAQLKHYNLLVGKLNKSLNYILYEDEIEYNIDEILNNHIPNVEEK